MILTATLKKQIESMSYTEMLRHRRFDAIGSEWWMGDVGAAMMDREKILRGQTTEDDRIEASKHLGWKYE